MISVYLVDPWCLFAVLCIFCCPSQGNNPKTITEGDAAQKATPHRRSLSSIFGNIQKSPGGNSGEYCRWGWVQHQRFFRTTCMSRCYSPWAGYTHHAPPQECMGPGLFCSWDSPEHEKWMPPSPNWDGLSMSFTKWPPENPEITFAYNSGSKKYRNWILVSAPMF